MLSGLYQMGPRLLCVFWYGIKSWPVMRCGIWRRLFHHQSTQRFQLARGHFFESITWQEDTMSVHAVPPISLRISPSKLVHILWMHCLKLRASYLLGNLESGIYTFSTRKGRAPHLESSPSSQTRPPTGTNLAAPFSLILAECVCTSVCTAKVVPHGVGIQCLSFVFPFLFSFVRFAVVIGHPG